MSPIWHCSDTGSGDCGPKTCPQGPSFNRKAKHERKHPYPLRFSRSHNLSIECEPCGRHGRYNIARLIQRYGDMKLPELRYVLADCPKARSGSAFMTSARSGTARTAGSEHLRQPQDPKPSPGGRHSPPGWVRCQARPSPRTPAAIGTTDAEPQGFRFTRHHSSTWRCISATDWPSPAAARARPCCRQRAQAA